MEKIIAIVPAAGLGSRLGLGKNKAFADVGGLPLLVQCMRMLADTDCVSRVIAVVRPQEVKEAEIDGWRNTVRSIIRCCLSVLLPAERNDRILLLMLCLQLRRVMVI